MTVSPDNTPGDIDKESATRSVTETMNISLYRYGSLVIALLLIAAALYCRIRLIDVPLERDEGGFAYIGQQILQGVSPYHSGNMKVLPGIHFAYAVIMMLFGENSAGIHTGLLVVNLISILLLFHMSRRLSLSIEVSVIAAGTYAILSVSQSVFGVFAHATHFVILFVLAGLIALLNGIEKKSNKDLFISGLCLGTSVLMKQHGIFFCLLAVTYLTGDTLKQQKPFRSLLYQIAVLTLGISVPYAVVCMYMYESGVFSEFWFWTVTQSMNYAVADFSADCLTNVLYYFKYVTLNIILFWTLSLSGLALLLSPKCQIRKKWFITSLLFFSTLAVLPGFSFYPHYFVVLLPCLSLLAGIAFEELSNVLSSCLGARTARTAVITLFLSVALFTLYSRSDYLFTLSPYKVSRTIYGLNPFPESPTVGQYIKNHTAPGTPIAVFGSEPQIYFYANRPSATDYLYMYPLVQRQQNTSKMQQEMIHEIENSSPEYIVFVLVPTSWMFEDASGNAFTEWIMRYLSENYLQVGVVELSDFTDTRFFWDSEAENRQPTVDNCLLVYKRISASQT